MFAVKTQGDADPCDGSLEAAHLGENGKKWEWGRGGVGFALSSPCSPPHFFRFPQKCAGSQATRDVIIKFPPKYYIFPPVHVDSKTRNKGNQRNKVYLFFTFCVVLSDLMGFLGR